MLTINEFDAAAYPLLGQPVGKLCFAELSPSLEYGCAMSLHDPFPTLAKPGIGFAPIRQAAGAGSDNQRGVATQIGLRLSDVPHLNVNVRKLPIGIELIALGAGPIHLSALPSENVQRLLSDPLPRNIAGPRTASADPID